MYPPDPPWPELPMTTEAEGEPKLTLYSKETVRLIVDALEEQIDRLTAQLAEARVEKIALSNALVIIDGIAVRHERGGIGKAQRIAREALAHAAAMRVEEKP